ncbi:hypothetical protein ACKTEK_10895 [Tepidamorphus sp. 3E244]|uniref:hypothetical protein n=1 Tax=Tepidamorphus sp. 3E244 TaxID=3385498 RepID=UPI0038FD23AE
MAGDYSGTSNMRAGHVQGYFGGTFLSADGDNADATVFGAAGRLNVPISEYWNIQGDAAIDALSQDGTLSVLSGTVHAFWRDPTTYAVGAFASLEDFNSSESDVDIYAWLVGLEGQRYMGDYTLYGQIWGGQLTDGSDDVNEFGVRGVVRYFGHENWRLDGEVSLNTLSADGDTITNFGLGTQAMYQFPGSAFAVFGRYDFNHLSGSGDSLDIHTVAVGFRGTFQSGGSGHTSMTLKEEDRQGATMESPHANSITGL